jgi:hypothetical protein
MIITPYLDAEKSQSPHVSKANRIGHILSKVFAYQFLAVLSVYNAMPILKNLFRKYMYGSEWTPEMPLKFKSFFDLHYSPAYELTYIGFVLDLNMGTFICVSVICI